jgi:hypothetical protein
MACLSSRQSRLPTRPGGWSNAPVETIVAAASSALGRPLRHPERLVGGDRTTVLRCRDDRGTVVVKAYRRASDALSAFTAEAAGLAFGAAGPRLLAVDAGFPLVVMEDLGSGPSLADLLLGDDPGAASAAVLTWARGLGRLAADTVGREPEFATLRARYDLGHSEWSPRWHADRCDEFPGRLAEAGVQPPPALDADLAEVLAAIDPAHYPVFSPGDICPDNNLLDGHTLRVFDFEGAGYHCAFLDAAYTRMPFATCWCVYRLPPGLAGQVEASYRSEVARAYPALAGDPVWHPGVRRATAAWTIDMTALLLPSAVAADRPCHPTRRPVCTWRQVLRYRWQHLYGQLSYARELPALAMAMRGLLAATGAWEVDPLPVYPAWREHG